MTLPLPAHEGQRRRETPGGERRGGVPGLQTLRGASVGGEEQGVSLPEELAHRLGCGVDERGGRLLDPLGTVEGILGENRGDAQGTDTRRLPPSRRRLVDRLDYRDKVTTGIRCQAT